MYNNQVVYIVPDIFAFSFILEMLSLFENTNTLTSNDVHRALTIENTNIKMEFLGYAPIKPLSRRALAI